MSTTAEPIAAPPRSRAAGAGPVLHPRLFTVDEYYAMAESGILHPEERVELIEGYIVPMSPISGPHIFTVNRLAREVEARLQTLPLPRPLVSVQNTLRLGTGAAPEPDVAVLRPEADVPRVPTAADVLLLVEVSVSTRAYDRDVKLPLYAGAAIPEVWLVVPEEQLVEVYRHPTGDGYAEMRTIGPEDALTLAAFPDLTPIPTALLFG